MAFSGFIEPDRELESLEDLSATLNIPVMSGYQATRDATGLIHQNKIFDRIVAKQLQLDLKYEDQCSARYYFDVVRTLRDFNGQFDRVAEVGVYMGGASSFLAGCMEPFDFDLDMIDINPGHLRFAYERVRRLYPESAKRIRLFHGDVPTYVRRVMMKETGHAYIVHHDGSHDFNQVVPDMCALSYVKDDLFAVIVQDTHLRGVDGAMRFVDLALYAVFGADLKYAPIGTTYAQGDYRTKPNQWGGNYFMPDMPEGMVLPMTVNEFRFPHPDANIDVYLPPEAPA